jgi:hypothetical protein
VEFQRDDRVERRRSRRKQIRRRRVGAAVLLAAVLAVVVSTSSGIFGKEEAQSQVRTPAPKPTEISEGLGTTILPTYRVVAAFGAPNGGPRLGILGVGTPAQAASRLMTDIVPSYSGGKPVLPALELIATIAHRTPQASGTYSTRYPAEQIEGFLAAARANKGILVLDIQPGSSPWMDEVRALSGWLKNPDVSLALDPEWSMKPGQIPGTVIGGITASQINEVSAYLQRIVQQEKLPQKLLIVHEFKDYQLTDQSQIVDREGVKVVLNVDGFGTIEQKQAAYAALSAPSRGKQFPMGFKLFYEEDNDPKLGAKIMSPYDVMALTPQPDVVVYE